jgi:isoquinoline 1-oxidoreductase subunit beta
MDDTIKTLTVSSRRGFLKTGAVATVGLVIGFYWPARDHAVPSVIAGQDNGSAFTPNAFLRIAPDNSVTVIAKHVEVGQGIYTGLATILAEELDADWSQIRVEPAPANPRLYNNLERGQVQSAGGSTSTRNSYEQHRQAGAIARTMLVAAAAETWNVPVGEITVEKGVVSHWPSAKRVTFGELAALAATLPPPAEVKLKDPMHFRMIGAAHTLRVDSKAKTNGAAMFTLDVSLPGMVTAVVARPTLFGATVKTFDATAAKAVPGVVDVVRISTGVAVVARSFWAAQRGRDALRIEWDESESEKRGTAELLTEYRALAERPGAVARRDGDAAWALGQAARTLTATFEFPYLAHAPMESLDCVVQISQRTAARSGRAIHPYRSRRQTQLG